MRYFVIVSFTLSIVLSILIALFSFGCKSQPSPSSNISSSRYVLSAVEEQLLAGAPNRIEQYRKGDASVRVTDDFGHPVNNATVHIEMLNHDFLFGCNLNLDSYQTPEQNQKYADSFAGLFNYATLPFFWNSYEPTQGTTRKDALTKMISWARDHNMKTKGHPLVWDLVNPDWVPESPDAFWNAICTRARRETQDFCGLIDYWTAMNEPVPDAKKTNPLRTYMKDDPASVTKDALDCAQKTCHDAKLIVNDYQNDKNFHKLLEDVKQSGGHFDVIGLESHMHVALWKLDQVWYVCELFKDFDLPLHFTEVTVLSGTFKTDDEWLTYHPDWNTTIEGEQRQAEYVSLLYTLLFSHPAVQSITWWDLSDAGAWQGAPAGLIRKDMTPKPAYNELMKLIHGDWWTDITVTTDANGMASWRGFYGEYRLSATAGQTKSETIVYLDKNKDNAFKLQLIESKSMPYVWLFAGAGIIIAGVLLLLYRKRRNVGSPRL